MFGKFLTVKLFADDVKVYVIIDDICKKTYQFTTVCKDDVMISVL